MVIALLVPEWPEQVAIGEIGQAWPRYFVINFSAAIGLMEISHPRNVTKQKLLNLKQKVWPCIMCEGYVSHSRTACVNYQYLYSKHEGMKLTQFTVQHQDESGSVGGNKVRETVSAYVSLPLLVQNQTTKWHFPLNFHTLRKL